ncbi:MAG: universal stress protein [Pseudomonadaceae bacterium]|nr:universal stress protein [Pseudomonadaceae bacterium]
MTKQVLCAIELNDEARDVTKIAAHIAEQHGAELTLMHVVPPMWQPYADLNFTPVVEAQVALEEDLLASTRDSLEKLAEKAGVKATNTLITKGDPVHTIAAQAADLDDVLIVMGVHNRSGLQRLLGSTAHGVLNNTECPILLVHADEHAAAAYNNVVVAVDTSKSLPIVLKSAGPFVKAAKKHQVISVVQSLAATMGGLQTSAFATSWPMTDMQEDLVKAVKATVGEELQKADINDANFLVIEGDPAHEICACAKEAGSDLIIMGSGQRNIIDRVLLGSTAHGVLNHTPCDVLIAR